MARSGEPSPRGLTEYTHSGRLFSGLLYLTPVIPLLSRWSLSSLRSPPLPFAPRRPGIYPFLCLSIPQSHLLRLSLAPLVRSKAVSQRRSAAREIPRTRYEFTFLLLYSTLACPPFCLLEPLVYLADLRLPYVSAAQLSHRSHSPSSLSLSLSLFPPVYAHDHAVPTSSSALLFSLFLLFHFLFFPAAVIIVVVDVGLHDAVSRSRKVRYGRGEQSRKEGTRVAFASRREKREEADPQIFNDARRSGVMYTRMRRDATTSSYRCGLLGTVPLSFERLRDVCTRICIHVRPASTCTHVSTCAAGRRAYTWYSMYFTFRIWNTRPIKTAGYVRGV